MQREGENSGRKQRERRAAGRSGGRQNWNKGTPSQVLVAGSCRVGKVCYGRAACRLLLWEAVASALSADELYGAKQTTALYDMLR